MERIFVDVSLTVLGHLLPVIVAPEQAMRFFANLFSAQRKRRSKARGWLSAPLENDKMRLANRKKQRMVDGFVWAENLLVARGCKVRDISAVGAAVDFWVPPGSGRVKEVPLPSRVLLYIVPDGTEVDCNVTWRKDDSIGLRFVGRIRPASRNFSGRQ